MPIETNNVVELSERALRYRKDNLRETTVGFALFGELVGALQSLSDRIDVLEGALRQIQTGADRGIAQFNERQSGRRSPIWRSVNVLQDNLAACYGTALAALIKFDSSASLTQGGKNV